MRLRPFAAPQTAALSRPISHSRSATFVLAATLGALLNYWQTAAHAAPVAEPPPAVDAAKPEAKAPDRGPLVRNSSMDANLFYQLLIGEIQARDGDFGTSYQLYFEAAKRLKSGQLYQRAVDVALQARAGEQALLAAQAWRQALPQDREASEYTAQILMALGRTTDLASPLESLIRLTPEAQRPQVIASLPRSLSRMSDRKAAAQVVDQATAPWREPLPGMAEAWAASSEAWLSAGDHTKAEAALDKARAANPKLLAVALLALDLMGKNPQLESIVTTQLQEQPTVVLRLAYARKLATTQRLKEAGEQLDAIVAEQPENAGAWITLAAVRLELKQLDPAEQATSRFLALQEPANKPPSVTAALADAAHSGLDPEAGYLMMAQIAESRGRLGQADDWLKKADPAGTKLRIQAARARMMANNGKVAQGRALIRAIPETEPRDALTKIAAESQLLRDVGQDEEAYKLLDVATQRYPNEPDILYDQAMLGEKLKRYDDAEKLLRRVIEIKPDHSHAYNALGYSLADRGIRLDEARTLITRALELRPGDPYITDSLGWLEFRAGRPQEAVKWLRQAYVTKSDTEIAAHLGEVLWTLGEQDEALRIWREGIAQDPRNETLRETLKRLKAPL